MPSEKPTPVIPAGVIAAVQNIAIKAAKNDTWMRPVVDVGDNLSDYGQFVGNHRDSWSGTNQYAQYQSQIWDQIYTLTDAGWGNGYYAEPNLVLLEDLVEVFWDTWEDKVRLYEVWEKAKADSSGKKRPLGKRRKESHEAES